MWKRMAFTNTVFNQFSHYTIGIEYYRNKKCYNEKIVNSNRWLELNPKKKPAVENKQYLRVVFTKHKFYIIWEGTELKRISKLKDKLIRGFMYMFFC